MSGILFVSSHYTGHGHKSITDALCTHLRRMEPAVEIADIDGFMLSGKVNGFMSKLYDRFVVNVPLIWKYYYQLGNIFPGIANSYMAKGLKPSLTELIKQQQPELIVSVHPCFVSPVEDILEYMGYKIPVVSLVADLDNVSRMWADKRTDCTICPTENARRAMVKYGVPVEKTVVTGFPIRDRFNHSQPDTSTAYYRRISEKGRLNFLLMNGSQGKGIVTEFARELLENFDCKVVILAGNNIKFKEAAENALRKYGERVEVCGFTTTVEQYMNEADILILRASPNVLMEAVNLCKPVIITGALTGQEEKNPEYAVNNNLGVICKKACDLADTINRLLADEGRLLNEIHLSQFGYRKTGAAENIAEILLSLMKGK